jgi:DNA-binding LacI/PurR family transcriptional regulator
LLYPALTTIREFPEQLGRKMVELVLNRIAKPGQKPKAVTMPIELVKRDSCRRIDSSQEIAPEVTRQSPTIA